MLAFIFGLMGLTALMPLMYVRHMTYLRRQWIDLSRASTTIEIEYAVIIGAGHPLYIGQGLGSTK